MYQLQRITAPLAPLIDLATAKAHLRVTHLVEDTTIELYASAAEAALDGDLGELKRALITQGWRLTLGGFPCGAIRLPLPPFQAVTAFKYTPRDGVETTLSPDAFRVRVHLNEAYLRPLPDQFWPEGEMESVVIEFTAGFGDAASDVPADIRIAALLTLDSVYENRGAVIIGHEAVTNPTLNALLTKHRVPSW